MRLNNSLNNFNINQATTIAIETEGKPHSLAKKRISRVLVKEVLSNKLDRLHTADTGIPIVTSMHNKNTRISRISIIPFLALFVAAVYRFNSIVYSKSIKTKIIVY